MNHSGNGQGRSMRLHSVKKKKKKKKLRTAGIAQRLERRIRDLKVAGSNPCRSGGSIFFSKVDFLC